MLKNIQQYLLANYPILWNIKLIPMLSIIVASQLIFFGLGYILTDNTTTSYSFSSGLYYLMYAASMLVGTLLLIFWLIRYNRNNGLKAFYPYTSTQLYVEWLFTFIICISIGYIPNSLDAGKAKKWQQTVSKAEQKRVLDILHKVSVLLPTDSYKFELSGSQSALMVGNADVDRTKFDTKLYNYEEDALTPDNPIEYVGPSLLYFKDNGRNSYWHYDEAATETVHNWLVNQQEDSIRALMQSFLDLHTNKDFRTNIDVDYWMSEVYNPPLYPVKNYISTSKSSYTTDYEEKFTEYYGLYNYYETIGNHYDDAGLWGIKMLIIFSIAFMFSICIFSARVTSGRMLVYALLATGIISFIFGLIMGLSALLSEFFRTELCIPIFWILTFIVIATLLTIKVSTGKEKGKSAIYLNIGIWLVPSLIPLAYCLFAMIQYMIDENNSRKYGEEEYVTILFTVNLIVSIIAMFPIAIFVRKWKALPED